MKVYIDYNKLTDSPYSPELKKSFLFDNTAVTEQLVSEIKHGQPTAILISGYRGVGKTSTVNFVQEKLGHDILSVNINLSKYVGYPNLLKKLIRQTYAAFSAYRAYIDSRMPPAGLSDGEKKLIDEHKRKLKELEPELDLLFERTFKDVVNSETDNKKVEHIFGLSLEFDGKKIAAFVFTVLAALNLKYSVIGNGQIENFIFIVAAIGGLITTANLKSSRTDTASVSKETSRKSLYDDEIAEYHFLNLLKRLKDTGLNVLITFDEIDKINDDTKMNEVINELKYLLLSGYANFLVISGQHLYYRYEDSFNQDDQILHSLFSKTVHIPFLNDATLKRFCLSLINNDTDKSNPKVIQYFDALILKSGRIPRKLVNSIRAKLIWDGESAYLDINELYIESYESDQRINAVINGLVDGKLRTITGNEVKLDFFTSHLYLWLKKIKENERKIFNITAVVNLNQYKNVNYYPVGYIEQLEMLSNLMMDEFVTSGLVSRETELNKFRWNISNSAQQVGPEDVVEYLNVRLDPNGPVYTNFILGSPLFENFVRGIYTDTGGRSTSMKGMKRMISDLVKEGILDDVWVKSEELLKFINIRDALVHGEELAFSETDVEGARFTMSRLKSELLQGYTFSKAKGQLERFDFKTENIDGVDFIAKGDNITLLFEVKSLPQNRLNFRDVETIYSKYRNYLETNPSQKCTIVVFYYLQDVKEAQNVINRFERALNELKVTQQDKLGFMVTAIDEQRTPDNRAQINLFLDSVLRNNSLQD